MNNESIEKLRLDRRLHSRRGWLAKQDLQTELDALPDSADKIMPPDEDEQSEEVEAAAGATPGAEAVPPAPGPSDLVGGGGA